MVGQFSKTLPTEVQSAVIAPFSRNLPEISGYKHRCVFPVHACVGYVCPICTRAKKNRAMHVNIIKYINLL